MTEIELRESFRNFCHHKKLEYVTSVKVGKNLMILAKGNNVIKLMRQFFDGTGLEYTEPSIILDAIGTYVTLE